MHTLCTLSNQSNTATAILIERVCVAAEKSATYAALAKKHEYSKERLRQILAKTISSIEQHFQSRVGIDHLRANIADILDRFRGLIDWKQLAPELAQSMRWARAESAECLRELFRAFLHEEEYLIEGSNISRSHACRECDVLVMRLHHVLSDSQSGVVPFSHLVQFLTPCVTVRE